MSFKLVMLLFVFLCLSFFTLPKSYPASLVGNCIKSAVQAMTGSKKKNLVLIGQEGTIDGYAAILEVLQHAVKENSPVEVVMPLQEKTFKTIFKMSLARLGNLKKISYMDVAPLADAANCDQIQKCGLLTARFFYKDYVFEATISSKKLIGENKDAFRLKFPEKINFYKQRRAAYRVDIPEDLDIMASIVRTSGLSFSAKVDNISKGGIHLRSKKHVPKMTDGSKVEITVYWPEKNDEISISATTIHQAGNTLRAKFEHDNPKANDGMALFVNALQRAVLQRSVKQ